MKIIKSKIPLVYMNNILYTSCTSNEENYYFTISNSNKLHVLDNSYNYIKLIELDNSYNCIAYNPNEKIFYLSTANSSNSIFYTDSNFKEIKELTLNIPKIYKDVIISLSYSCTNKTLYIVTKHSILALGEGKQNIKDITKNIKNNTIKLIDENTNIIQTPITQFTSISNINDEIYIAYNRESESFISKLINGSIVDEQFVDYDCSINSIMSNNQFIKLFVLKKFNYIYETTISVKENRSYSSYNIDYDDYISKNKHYTCNDCSSCNDHCSKSCNIEYSICQTIESIALEETRYFSYIKC